MIQQLLSLPTTLCSATALPYPNLFGAEFLHIEASLVTNYSRYIHEGYYLNNNAANVTNVDFCNVTLTYSHPGQNDVLKVQAWLPTDTWNGRMQGVGGGGWAAGMFELSYMTMAGGLAEGYMSITSDGGHTSEDPRDWALLSPGNVDLYALQNLASVSLNDAAIIGKSLAKSFYGRVPEYSYWNGCSQGGRQGLMLAQRHPDAFDGIVASAPATNWGELGVSTYWPQFIMNQLDKYPYPCELEAITKAAIEACDGNDGAQDGLVSAPDSCSFDARTIIGTSINCSAASGTVQISAAAATIANAAWAGPRMANGSFLWYGPNHEAPLTGFVSLANTECFENGTCVGRPFPVATDWIRLFLQRDPAMDISTMTQREYERFFHASVQQYNSIIGTSDPNLAEFRDSGGKMLTYQGLADQVLVPESMRHYYEAIRAADPEVHKYFRLFESPGLYHCFGGPGGYPGGIFKALVDWVESDKAPDMLDSTTPVDKTGMRGHRLLCPYPQQALYKGTGDIWSVDSFYCE